MILIVLSALVTAINDIEFSSAGYVWSGLNVVANVAYLASLRIYLRDPDISPLDKTFHSSSLSIIPILPMAFIQGEVPGVIQALFSQTFNFKMAYFLSGFLTTGVCASAFWTITVSNGSTLSFVGGLNKIPIILLSLVMFDMDISAAGWVGVSLGVFAGIVFIRAKAVSRLSTVLSEGKSIYSMDLETESEDDDDPFDDSDHSMRRVASTSSVRSMRKIAPTSRLGDDFDLPVVRSNSQTRISSLVR